jgi:hypothetical protein
MGFRHITLLCVVALAIGVPVSGCGQADPQAEGVGPERVPTATASASKTPEQPTPPFISQADPTPIGTAPETAPMATPARTESSAKEEATPVASPAAPPTNEPVPSG